MSDRARMSKKSAREHYAILQTVKRLKGDDLKTFLFYMNDDGHKILADCVYNALHCEAVSPSNRAKLKKRLWNYRGMLREISNQDKPISLKKKKIVQFGSGFGLIAAALIPVLVEVAKSLFTKKKSEPQPAS